MKSKRRFAARIGGFLLALGLVLLPYADAVAMNEDVEMGSIPGGECGDPDIPSFTGFGVTVQISLNAGRLVVVIYPTRAMGRPAPARSTPRRFAWAPSKNK